MHTIQEQIAAVEAANKSGNYAEAEQRCRTIVQQATITEEHIKILLLLSESLWRRNLGDAALPFATHALRLSQEVENISFIAKALSHLGHIYTNLSDYGRALEHYQQALAYHEKLSNQQDIINTLGNIAIVHRHLSDYPNTLEYHNRALSIAKEIDYKVGIAYNLGCLGIAYDDIADYQQALEFYNQALSIYKELGNRNGEATFIGNIGGAYFALSDYSRALEYLQQALAIEEELDAQSGVAIRLSNIASVFIGLTEYTPALEYLEQAIAKAQGLGMKNHIGAWLGNIGYVYSKLGDYHRALEYMQQSLLLTQEIGYKGGSAFNWGNMGVAYLKLSDYTAALSHFQKALRIDQEIGNRSNIAIWLSGLGNLYARQDFADYNISLAKQYLLESIDIMEEIGTRKELYDNYKSLADIYEQSNEWHNCTIYLKKYYELKDTVQSEEAKKLADKFAFERQIAVMEKEREVTDMLLHKFLPSPIVPEVKAKEGRIVVQQFQSLSALFADIAGFTQLSMDIKPEILIEMLNYIFTKFDVIIKQAGGHRLRTIGDGYFAICGAPDTVENHQYNLAKAALAMQQDIDLPEHIKQELPQGTIVNIRIGLHCGEAVCGMVGGLEKWQYDAYGDTINTASRMESHGEAGKIHISEDFKNSLIDYDEFIFLPREPIFIKGKGLMNTYFLQ